MKKSLISSLFFISLLSGCASTPKYQEISENDAMKGINELRNEATKAKELKQKNLNDEKVHWIQASNKNTPCKTSFITHGDHTLPPGIKVYWDGECKDGYAFGLGREFTKANMIDSEDLAEYSGGASIPSYYMHADRLENMVLLGDPSNQMFLLKKLQKEDTKTSIINERIVDDIQGTGLYYQIGTSTVSDFFGTKISEIGFGKNHLAFMFVENMPEFKIRVVSNFKDSPYSATLFNNGTVIHVNEKTKEMVTLPKAYLDSLESMQNEILTKIESATPSIQIAERKKNYYKSLICKDSIQVDFMPEHEYKAICTEYEYFTPYMAAVLDTTAKEQSKLESQKQRQADKEFMDRSLGLQQQQIDQAERAQAQRRFDRTMRDIQNAIPKTVNCFTVGGVTTCQ